MVDFARETVIDVRGVAERFKVSTDTVRRWMRSGLEKAKVGGKVVTSVEAVQRFSRQGNSEPATPGISPEALAAIRELKERFGIDIGMEVRDGRSQRIGA